MPFDALFVPADVREATGERAWLQAMLDFEVALARRAGARRADPGVGGGADRRRARSTSTGSREAGRASGNPAAALVEALPDGAHRGATSQDVMDTAAVLVARRTLPLIDAELAGVAAACARLAADHRGTPMAARTLLQQALPTTFGFKAAGWLAGVDEARDLLAAVPLGGRAGRGGGHARLAGRRRAARCCRCWPRSSTWTSPCCPGTRAAVAHRPARRRAGARGGRRREDRARREADGADRGGGGVRVLRRRARRVVDAAAQAQPGRLGAGDRLRARGARRGVGPDRRRRRRSTSAPAAPGRPSGTRSRGRWR